MENVYKPSNENQKLNLPTGFRFHPTDEELIKCYLTKKIADNCFCAVAIAEVDLNKCEPWILPGLAKMGENEWYFFCVRDKKYPTGLRANRATEAGYWKATGKDKEIIAENGLIGLKKTLVFYKGRAPRGEKTNWVIHEYRLEGKQNQNQYAKSEWVVCRVFEKGPSGRKLHVPNQRKLNSSGNESSPPSSLLPPPLMHSPPETRTTAGELSHVTNGDLNQTVEQNTHDDIVDSMETPILNMSSSATPFAVYPFGNPTLSAAGQPAQIANQIGNSQYPDFSYLPQEQSVKMVMMVNHESSAKQVQKAGFSYLPQEQSMKMVMMGNHESSAKQVQKAEFSYLPQEQSMKIVMMGNHESSAKQVQKAEFSEGRDFDADMESMMDTIFANQEHSSACAGHVDTDCIWNY